MKIQCKTSDWFGVEHVSYHVDLYRHINMETLCKLYPQLFNPEIWLSATPPKPVMPKKRKLIKHK